MSRSGEHLDLLIHDRRVERAIFYKGLFALAVTIALIIMRELWWV